VRLLADFFCCSTTCSRPATAAASSNVGGALSSMRPSNLSVPPGASAAPKLMRVCVTSDMAVFAAIAAFDGRPPAPFVANSPPEPR